MNQPDPLALAVRTARDTSDSTPSDSAIAAAVLEALIDELPEHYSHHAYRAYKFWLRNRIAALQAGMVFHPWVMTSSYMQYPELLALDLSEPTPPQPELP